MANIIKVHEHKGQVIRVKVLSNDRGPKGNKGDAGNAATIFIAETSTLPAGAQATVVNTGTANDVILAFGIPKGDTGATGESATVSVGDTDTLPAGNNAVVTNAGTETHAVLNFKIPQGPQGVRGEKGEKGDKGDTGERGVDGADGAIHYTAGTGINITDGNVIEATGAAVATWGGIGGDISEQTDLQDALNAVRSDIPTTTSELTNNSNFVEDADYVHTDNNYTTADKNKLADVSAGAEVNVQANWTETDTSSDAYIQNKPTLATVATSGSYNDLSDKPAAPTANDATLTIQNNGTTVATFTANSSTDTTANIISPVITMTTVDPGEGAALAENHFIAVYEA